jgi:hypothetical protein
MLRRHRQPSPPCMLRRHRQPRIKTRSNFTLWTSVWMKWRRIRRRRRNGGRIWHCGEEVQSALQDDGDGKQYDGGVTMENTTADACWKKTDCNSSLNLMCFNFNEDSDTWRDIRREMYLLADVERKHKKNSTYKFLLLKLYKSAWC